MQGPDNYLHNFGDNQLEKLEAAKSAYLWLPVVRLIGLLSQSKNSHEILEEIP